MNITRLKEIDLNLLLVFNCVYQEKSLTRAGESLGRTQSAVSHALERLRNIFQDPLFVRGQAGMVPTARAKELFEPIQQALATIEGMFQANDQFVPETLKRCFRLSMSDYCEIVVLPSLMRYLSLNAPNVEVEVVLTKSATPYKELESDHFELLIGSQDVGAGIKQQKLFEDDFVCMVSMDHPEIQGSITMDQFLKYRHVLFARRKRGDRLVEEALKQENIQRKVAMRTPHILVAPTIIENSPFIATLPRKLAEALNPEGLQLLSPPIEFPKLLVMQYWHETRHQEAEHKWFRQVLQALKP